MTKIKCFNIKTTNTNNNVTEKEIVVRLNPNGSPIQNRTIIKRQLQLVLGELVKDFQYSLVF